MDKLRRELMAERTRAIQARDWTRANELTQRIADLPLTGVPTLTTKDIDKYRKGKGKG